VAVEVVIGRVLRRSDGVTDTGPPDAGCAAITGIRTPESAEGEGCRLERSGHSEVDRRNFRLGYSTGTGIFHTCLHWN
jgi:hypothetical protein